VSTSFCAAIMTLMLGAEANAAGLVPTWTGCYNASSGTINKLAQGNEPLKPCNAADILVRFAEGDITKITVGPGLSGGGDNGDIVISLDAKFSLPQSCFAGAVAK